MPTVTTNISKELREKFQSKCEERDITVYKRLQYLIEKDSK